MAVDRRSVLVGGLAVTALRLGGGAAAALPALPPTLTAGPAKLALVPAAPTAVLAYNGQVPGPLLRVAKGAEVALTLVNKLDQPTSLRWHGVRLPEAMDGVAGLTQAAVRPGDSFAVRFTPPDAGLYWYHPDVGPGTAAQLARGLYGVLIVDEPEPPLVDDDVLLVLDDWILGPDAQVRDADAPAGAGPVTSLVTANSAAVPLRRTVRPGARLRLRLLNACTARLALVACTGCRATVIAVDGQPSELFEPARGTVPIGPGARFEMILDLPRGRGATATVSLQTEDLPAQTLLAVATNGMAVAPRGPVLKLPDNPALPTRIHLEDSLKRDLVVTQEPPAALAWTMAGRPVDGLAGKPLFTVKRGAPVTLAFVNRTAAALQAHVHGHAFRVLHDLDDGWDPYWRESVLVAPGRAKHVAFVADNPGRWKVEALALDRPGASLAAFFAVDGR